VNVLEKRNILGNLQFGFGKSTKDAVASITDSVSDHLDNIPSNYGVSDLSKVSEYTENNILLDKFCQYEIHGMSHNFMKFCLRYRTQQVKITRKADKH
jgi:hypothetical protein